jgi:putative membrane protein
VFHVFALWLVSELFGALQISGGVVGILTAGLLLTLLMLLIRPILKILFIPINFITFGIAGWFINAVILFLLTIIMPEVIVREYSFPGFQYLGFVIPSIKFNYLVSFLLVSISITLIANLLRSISEE